MAVVSDDENSAIGDSMRWVRRWRRVQRHDGRVKQRIMEKAAKVERRSMKLLKTKEFTR